MPRSHGGEVTSVQLLPPRRGTRAEGYCHAIATIPGLRPHRDDGGIIERKGLRQSGDHHRTKLLPEMFTPLLLLGILFALMAIFFSLQRGFNQVIRGVAEIHQQLGGATRETSASEPHREPL